MFVERMGISVGVQTEGKVRKRRVKRAQGGRERERGERERERERESEREREREEGRVRLATLDGNRVKKLSSNGADTNPWLELCSMAEVKTEGLPSFIIL